MTAKHCAFTSAPERVMKPVNPYREGLVWGVVLAIWPVGLALLVAAGAAQAVTDFVLRLFRIPTPYQVGEFRFITAAAMVLASAVIGYIGGMIGGVFWNRSARRTAVVAAAAGSDPLVTELL